MEKSQQIEPLRLYSALEAAALLKLSETELGAWCRQAGIRDRLVAGSRRYWGYDLLKALDVLPLPNQLTEILPHRGYSAEQATFLLGGIKVDTFRQWAAGKIPAVVIGDRLVYPGRNILEALGLSSPPLDRIEPYSVYTRAEATQALRIGKNGFADLVADGHIKPIIIGTRKQLFLGQDLLEALKRLQASPGKHKERVDDV